MQNAGRRLHREGAAPAAPDAKRQRARRRRGDGRRLPRARRRRAEGGPEGGAAARGVGAAAPAAPAERGGRARDSGAARRRRRRPGGATGAARGRRRPGGATGAARGRRWPGGATERTRNKIGTIPVAIAVPTIAAVLAAIVAWFYSWRRRRRRMGLAAKTLQPYSTSPDDIRSIDSLLLDLSTLRIATDDFAEHKRLGEGGFGVVYKGDLPERREIAVKRLSQTSSQGIKELKTELLLVAKLNHNNLVRLVGVCLEEHEKILVYEYMPNRSLDTILFDAEKTKELDWGKRFKIINGIARGLQYLHEDSQLKIVHRDLKASNVLLDSDYNPKISDFGLAKIFGGDQSQIVTHRIAGTYGYMSPEYAMRGQYSIKSDVFSFGVLVLEIVTGRRNCGTYDSEQDADLINATWEHWTREKAIELIDQSLSSHCPTDQLLKCIHIGLLCVQQKPADRPLMSAVNLMLISNTVRLPPMSRPAFCTQVVGANSDVNSEQNLTASQWPGNSRKVSSNEVSITELEPR